MRRIEPVRRPVHGRLLALLILCVVGILFGCAAIQERVADSRFPDGLAPGPYFTKSGGATDRRYLKAGETLNNWTEMGVLQTFVMQGMTPHKLTRVFEIIKGSRDKGPCIRLDVAGEENLFEALALTVQSEVIGRDETSLTYEDRIKDCPGTPDQHRIGRILFGKWNVFHLAIMAKIRELPDERRRVWIERLGEAKLYSP